MKHTVATVRQVIKSRIESNEPDLFLEALKPMAGKPITIRLCDKMPGGSDRWRLRRQYGMTHLETRGYPGDYKNEYSLLLFHSEQAEPLGTPEEIAERNACYYAGRVERNRKRAQAMQSDESCERLANCLNAYTKALTDLEAASTEYKALSDYYGPFNPEEYEFLRMVDPDRKATNERKNR